MPCCVCAGASITCSFGAAPSVLNVLPAAKVMSSQALASIMDNISMVNIIPFGMCSSPSNPNVASASAAALGVLTPMPCMPMIAGPWMPGSPKLLIGGRPALTSDSRLMCQWGGLIQIAFPGTVNIQC
ncbi:DUF4280 domain-containing protein [Enterocloster aldenensis]|uniref:DUF4280 domain-containing protein n=1 Tax=Enterocloster aldenensis TaxID=358742 RepID=UPI000E4E9B60|nr:DUF4280 domain-containing protein [Enterocloster aldenensis]